MADLFTRRALSLTSGTPQVTGTIDLDPQTEWIEVAIDRPTSVSSGITWGAGTTIGVSIDVLLDGQLYRASGRSTGGIRSSNGTDVSEYRLRWHLPAGYFGGETGKRLGETRQSTFQVRLTVELLRGATLTSSVAVTTAAAPLTLALRHNSVAYDTASSTQEQTGDGVLSFSHTASGASRAAFAYSGNGVASPQAGATTYDGVSMTELWDEVFQTSYRHAGYSLAGIPTGTVTVTNTLAGSPSAHLFGVVTLTGVNQGTPVGTPVTATGTTAAPSVTVTDDGVGDMILAGVTSIDNDFEAALGAVGADQTERWRQNTTTDSLYGAVSTQAGNGDGVMSWADSTATQWGIGAVTFFQVPPSAALTGTATASITEADIVAGGKTIIATLSEDTFISATPTSTISVRASVGWAVVTADSVVTLPTHQAGDRIYVFATWKAFGTTALISGWTEVTEFADGSVAASANLGSVKVGAWYLDATSSSETNPTLDWSVAPVPGARCAITLSKGAGETWDTPTFVTAAIASAITWSATASSTITIKDGAIVLEVAGFRDESATMTRSATTALTDDGSPTVTWNGDVVEDPATHASSTSSNDISADLIHRFVTTGAAGVNLTATGTLAAAETGAVLWVHQGVTSPVFNDARQAFINGFDSAQAEGTGWDAEVKAKAAVTEVVRTSDTVATWTIAAQAGYNISAQETITGTIHASILTSGVAIVATPTVTIDPSGGAAFMPRTGLRLQHAIHRSNHY